MKKGILGRTLLGIVLAAGLFAGTAQAADREWTGNEWNVSEQEMAKVENLKIGREDARSSFFPFADPQKALESQQIGKDRNLEDAWYQSLDTAAGQIWKFYYVSYPGARGSRPDNRHIMNPDYDDSSWDEITVPKSWEASYNEDGTFKYNPPQYSNTDYPWITQNPNPSAPHAPTQFNPVGFYRTKVHVDPSFQGRNVFLTFEGVESAFYLWVNGHQVGYSEDSFTSKEFKIDEYLNYDGNDTIAVEVFKWSSGSWFEDQDMLTLAGIFRSVYLTSKDDVELRDFTINTTKTGSGIDPAKDYEDFNFELYANLRNLEEEKIHKNGLTVRVDLYDQEGERVAADALEEAKLEQTVNAADFTGTDSLGRQTATVKLSAKVKNPAKWSAESPNLYKALITLEDENGEIIETTAYRFGFRMIEIKNENTSNAQMILNGQPLLIKGVNIHENNYETGRAMTYELIRKDVSMMKEYNFNAIRMSHYSHDFRYYDLADEMGLYICDEANIETHGNRSIPSNNENYLPAVLDRLSSMFYRSKNFPSVIILSLGNEAGSGSVFGEMNKWLKGNYTGAPDFYVDDTLKGDIQKRPVHYEGDNDNADIKSNMYPGINDVLGAANVDKPYVLCEYSHAMGTSGGYYQDYWDIFESKENIQGGWIWDWVDQSLKTYVEPEAFPAQTSLGWQSGYFVSQDANQTKVKPTKGPECLSEEGVDGGHALNGGAYAEGTPDVLNLNSSFTIEAWVYPEDNERSFRTIVAKGDNQYKLQTINGQIQFNTFCNGWNEAIYEYDEETWAGRWHHVAATYDAKTRTASVYCDDMNEPKSTTVFEKAYEDGTFSKSSYNFGVGYDSQNAGSRDWKGMLDNVRVYDRALTSEELSKERQPSDAHVVYWEDFEGELETEEVDTSNKVYKIRAQDAVGTELTLLNKSAALKETGASGEEGDRALRGVALAKDTPEELDINGTFSVEAWVYPTDDSGQRVIIGKGDTQYVLRTQNGGLCLQTYSEVGQKWNQLICDYDDTWIGNWHHVAATYDAATKTAKMYIDDMSTPAGEQTFTNVYEDGSFGKNGESFAVGRETNNTGRDWKGLLDDVRVYDRVLTEEELQSEERTAQDEGVVFWQDFNGEPAVSIPTVSEGYLGFGGDWGDSPNSSNFCANGIVSAQRIPHGAMLEIKRVHQDYVMELKNAAKDSAEIEIRSRALFTNASAYDFVWELKEDGKTIRSGEMELDIEPLEMKNIRIEFDRIEPQEAKEYYLMMKFVLKEDTEWAKAGHEISGAQADMGFDTEKKLPEGLEGVPKLSYKETEDAYVIKGQDFEMVFDRSRGTIRSLVYKGTELFAQDGLHGPQPNFWRAPTDGDRLSNISTAWRYAGQKRTEVVTEIEDFYSKALKICVSGELAPSVGAASYTMTFIVYGDGQILVENSVSPEGFTDNDLIPVVGNEMQIAGRFEHMTWFGRGSDQEGLFSESYADRYAQQFIDLYEDEVENQFIPYIRNQTFGNKMDVSWAAFTDEEGKGLIISSVGEGLNVNAQHYTQEELTSFGSKHPYESKDTENVVLNLDYRNMAVGYDPGWLDKRWYDPEDLIRPTQTFRYSYKISPVERFTAEKAFESQEQSYILEDESSDEASKDLGTWIRFMESLEKDEYTKASWAVLEKAVEAARAVDADKESSRAQIDQAIADLIQAFGGLEYGVQRQHLEIAVQTAQSILDASGNYEESSLAALKKAIEEARAVLADESATQDAVNQAAGKVIDAISQVIENADLASLESLLKAVESLDADKYTSESYQVLAQAIEAAKAVLADSNREESQLAAAYTQLAEAVRGLEMKGNKAALRAVIEKAEDILANASAYTESGIRGLKGALKAALAVYETEDATMQEIAQATEELTNVLVQVRLKGDLNQDGKVSTADSALLLQYTAEMTSLDEKQYEGADVDGNGVVDTKDAVLILQYSAEKVPAF